MTTDREPPHCRVHDAVGTVIGVLGCALLVASPWLVDLSGPEPFYKGPLVFPLIALALVIVGSVPAALRLLRPSPAWVWRLDGNGVPRSAIGLFLLLCLFPAAVSWLGVQAATFLFTLGGLVLVGYRRPGPALLIATLLALAIHLAFRAFLDIWFPAPQLPQWLGAALRPAGDVWIC